LGARARLACALLGVQLQSSANNLCKGNGNTLASWRGLFLLHVVSLAGHGDQSGSLSAVLQPYRNGWLRTLLTLGSAVSGMSRGLETPVPSCFMGDVAANSPCRPQNFGHLVGSSRRKNSFSIRFHHYHDSLSTSRFMTLHGTPLRLRGVLCLHLVYIPIDDSGRSVL
jgi:hypothetical protein